MTRGMNKHYNFWYQTGHCIQNQVINLHSESERFLIMAGRS